MRSIEEASLAVLFRDNADAPPPRRSRRRRLVAALVGTLVVALSVGATTVPAAVAADAATDWVDDYWNNLPTDLPTEVPLAARSVMLDADGVEFAQFYSQNRIPVQLSAVSPLVTSALLSTEDRDFYDHNGVDYEGMARALANNLNGGATQGGSTLTQQLVENLLVLNADSEAAQQAARAQSVEGKIQELRYALALEQQFSKDEILEMYLNTVYLGSGSYGVAAAAARYWGIAPADVSLSQAALLAGLVQSPVAYDPIDHPEMATARRDTVLRRMLANGAITEEQYAAALAEPLTVSPTTPPNGCAESSQPLYCAHVLDVMRSDATFGATQEERDARLARGGLTIRTAMVPAQMTAAADATRRALGVDNRVAAGVAIVEPGTGRVTGLGQNRDFGSAPGQTEIVYATTPSFQPGSSFKPITLAAALEQGFDINSTMTAPSYYFPNGLDAPSRGFVNDSSVNFGAINAFQAMTASSNVWFVKLVEQYGVRNVATMAQRLGMVSMPSDLTGREGSITLGSYETSPLEMATVYATLAAHGVECNPISIISATVTATGEAIDVPQADCHQEITSTVADTVVATMQSPLPASLGAPIDGRPAAGKTGTTNNNAAAWFVGFTPQYVAAVWVGDPRGGQQYPLKNVRAYGRTIANVYGSQLAGPIWQDLMPGVMGSLPVENFTPPGQSTALAPLRAAPDVRGVDLAAAVGTLESSGYTVEISTTTAEQDDLTPANVVVGQTPAPGTSVGPRAVFTLTLSAGSDVGVDTDTVPTEAMGN